MIFINEQTQVHLKGFEMASIHGPVVCPVVRAKQTGVYSVPVDSPLLKAKLIRSGFWGLKGLNSGVANVSYRKNLRNCRPIRCSFSSSSDGNGSMAENFSESNADYVNSSVVEAGNYLLFCLASSCVICVLKLLCMSLMTGFDH